MADKGTMSGFSLTSSFRATVKFPLLSSIKTIFGGNDLLLDQILYMKAFAISGGEKVENF